MLAIAETLAAERELHHAFCDTDSMFFVHPEDMPRETFLERVQEIAGPMGWFQSLNPYRADVPLFALEDVNFRLKDEVSGKTLKGVFEPLFCLAVSAKRYALANFGPNCEIIIRKASAHGLGDVMEPREYDPLIAFLSNVLMIENKEGLAPQPPGLSARFLLGVQEITRKPIGDGCEPQARLGALRGAANAR